jgi:Zn-finger protein
MNRDEMINLYRGPSIVAFYQVSVYFGKVVSEEKIFKNWAIKNKNFLWQPCLLMNRDKMSILYRGPSIDAFYQISVHLGKRFQRRRFFINQPIRNKNCLCRPCLFTDQDEMSNLYRGPSIDASYQVSVQLAKQFQGRRFFRNQPIRNKNCLWRPCLLTDQDEMSNLYRGPSIDASYQVSVQLAKQFQGRRFFRNRPFRNKNCLWWPCLLTNRDEMSNLYREPSIDAFYQISVHLG